MDEEVARLKEIENDCEAAVELNSVQDWTVAGLDLSQISEDSSDRAEASSAGEEPSSS